MVAQVSPFNQKATVFALPGVPPLLGGINNAVAPAITGISSVVTLARRISDALNPKWGIFSKTGAPVITSGGGIAGIFVGATVLSALGGPSFGSSNADSVVGVEFTKEWKIADYPMEQGAFQSYNKVSTPFTIRMQFSKSGTPAEVGAFLNQVDSVAKSMELFSAVMPEKKFKSVNVTHYDFARNAKNGATMVLVDIWMEEVRVTGSQQFTSTQSTNGAPPVSTGQSQPQSPTPSGLDAGTTASTTSAFA